MEYYITDENNIMETNNIINHNILYDEKQKNKFKKVMKELMNNWSKTIIQLKIMYDYDINIDKLMKKISKIYFLNFRCSKEYLKERKQLLNDKKRRIKKLQKLRGICI